MELVMKNLFAEMGAMEDMAVILKRFGDEQSTLLDRYERLSFEVQLNQAILGRSMSEPSVSRQQAVVAKPVRQWRRGFQKILKKLLKPIRGKKSAKNDDRPDFKDPKIWKTFSRSLRV